MLTSTSEVLTPAELSMASVLSRTPRSAASMRPRWVMPRLAPSPITLRADSAPVMRIAIVGAVADRLVGLASTRAHRCRCRRSTEQIDRRLAGSRSSPPAASPWPWRGRAAACACGDSAISLAARGKTPPPVRDQRLVVVLPARARQLEQALALGEARLRIGVGIDEDVAMVEGGDQLDGRLAAACRCRTRRPTCRRRRPP